MKDYSVYDSQNMKILRSTDHNYVFNKNTGMFARWGRTKTHDPDFGYPEIADIEVTTKCSQGCPFCYKGNTPDGKNMSLATFKEVMEKLPTTVCQVAFGADSTGTANQDLIPMMEHCRSIGVIPNITVADVSDEMASKFAKLCGAVAVSHYSDEQCFNSVDRLHKAGLQQINIHAMTSEETFGKIMSLIPAVKSDPRLKGLRAVVLLSLKKKGRGITFTSLPQDKFTQIVQTFMSSGLNIGMDSCSAVKFKEAIKGHVRFDSIMTLVEPCESTCFSLYVDVDGKFFPCSFTGGIPGWEDGISVPDCKSFLEDIWWSPRVNAVREKIVACKNCERSCFHYDV